MDMVKIGAFLAALRKEKGLTQAQLGEELGVSNKTVSRWETGSYMPPVEMLQLLGGLYGVSINEILSGERLESGEYRAHAEENIKSALSASAFTARERLEYYKKKWRREHIARFLLCAVIWLVLLISLRLQGVEGYLIGTIGGLLAMVYYVVLYNQMMRYAEARAFGGEQADS